MALILVTRPQPDADTTAAKLRSRGHEALVAPLLSLEAIEADLTAGRPWAGVLVTSANALRTLPQPTIAPLAALPLLAVGRRTAEAARDTGFSDVQSADGDMRALVRLAIARVRAPDAPLLYLAGEERSGDLAAELDRSGIRVETRIVYRMRAERAFPQPARTALAAGRIGGVVHFSRRSAETFCACAQADGVEGPALSAVQYCLSEAVGAVFRPGMTAVRIAPRPEEDALLDLIPR